MTIEAQQTQANPIGRWLILIGLALILGGSWIYLNQIPQVPLTTELSPAPLRGYPAPEISLISTTGETMSLSDYRGDKPVVINFWASWCAPCRAEMPELQEIHRERDDVILFSVNATSQDNQHNIEAFIEEFGITFPVALDVDGATIKTYNVPGLPTTIFVGKNGVIQGIHTGPIKRAEIEARIPELL